MVDEECIPTGVPTTFPLGANYYWRPRMINGIIMQFDYCFTVSGSVSQMRWVPALSGAFISMEGRPKFQGWVQYRAILPLRAVSVVLRKESTMKFKSPITAYCSGYVVMAIIVCGWLLVSEGVVFSLALFLSFLFLSSLTTSLIMISDTVWGNHLRWVSNAYKTESASEQDIEKNLKNARRIFICVCVISAILSIPVFIETGDILQI